MEMPLTDAVVASTENYVAALDTDSYAKTLHTPELAMTRCRAALMWVGLTLSAASHAEYASDQRQLWRADLKRLEEQLPAAHADAFRTLSQDQFVAAIKRLQARLPQLERYQVIVELQRIVAMIGDGHTRLWLTPNDDNGFRRLPLHLYRFGSDIRVVGILPEHASALGAKLISIDETPVAEVVEQIATVVQRDNEFTLQSLVPRYMTVPEVLHTLGIARQLDQIRFTFETADDAVTTVKLTSQNADTLPDLRRRSLLPDFNAATLRLASLVDNLRELPVALKHLDRSFHEHYLTQQRAYFLQINGIANAPEQSLSDFIGKATARAEASDAEKLILDLRYNSGGNNYLNFDVVQHVGNSRFNQPGSLFVLIGRETFSAASHLVSMLELHTEALFVGEPTGAAPNHFGDAVPLSLPGIGVSVSVSGLFWQNTRPFPHEQRRATFPDLAAPPSIEMLTSGRDPALAVVAEFEVGESLYEHLLSEAAINGADALRDAYRRYRQMPTRRWTYTADTLFRLARSLLAREDSAGAIAAADIGLDDYPQTVSLLEVKGDALRAVGDYESARRIYQQILKLAPNGLAKGRVFWRLQQMD